MGTSGKTEEQVRRALVVRDNYTSEKGKNNLDFKGAKIK